MELTLSYILGLGTALFLFFAYRFLDRKTTPMTKRSARRRGAVIARAVEYRLSMGPFVVALGGGTGLSTLLRALKSYTRNIVAVVAVTDEGGSSGKLKQEWGVLPPGDVRNCIVALAENDNALKRLLDFRFDRGELAGHSLGNLMLLAVSEQFGDFRLAVEEMNYLLAIRGRVLPVTTEAVTLTAETREGERLRGELAIAERGPDIARIWLEPRDPKPLKDVLRSIDEGDLIALGPGSLFTSVLPNLLIREVSERIRRSTAPKVYICNLMTQPGETGGFSVEDHVRWVAAALRSAPEYVVVNDGDIPNHLLDKYRTEGAEPLYLKKSDRRVLEEMGCTVLQGNLVQILDNSLLRHNGQVLSEILVRLCRELKEE
ncbi:MAG TPA: hypothetical protein DIC53_04305 [Synergistaceae bacterium]|nr:hypothetical protein [Synergistaceae bacterium]